MKNLDDLRSEYLVGPMVLLLFFVVLLPLPSLILDVLLVGNMVLAFLLILLAVGTHERHQLSVFPTFLLAMTLGRLALNVASTRLILTQGANFGGVLVRAFGVFVMGGSYAVGLILFAVLVTIQYMVVGKGSERVAEVAARFRLDSLPMKQMGIETRVSQGALTLEGAEVERKLLQQESDFYGAMDGASKFVKGETVAGMMITGINLVGGILLGLSRGENFSQVAESYALLTVGDGLVGLVPSMMLATAAGLVITRTEGEGTLSSRVVREFLQSGHAVGVACMAVGVLMALLGGLSGVDATGFLILSLLCFGASALFFSRNEDLEAFLSKGSESRSGLVLRFPTELEESLRISFPGSIEPCLESSLQHLERSLGWSLSSLRVDSRDSGEEIEVLVDGVRLGSFSLPVDRYLVLFEGEEPVERLEGDPAKDPLGNRPAKLIAASNVGEAVALGCQVLSPPEILGARLGRLFVEKSQELMGYPEVESWIETLAERSPSAVRALKEQRSVLEVQSLLRGLLAEKVSLAPSLRILEAMLRSPSVKGQALLELVRSEIGRWIVAPLLDPEGILEVVTLRTDVEESLKQSLRNDSDGREVFAAPFDLLQDLMMGFRARAENLRKRGKVPILVASRRLRPHLLQLMAKPVPDLRVLAHDEVAHVEVRILARLAPFPRPTRAGVEEEAQVG